MRRSTGNSAFFSLLRSGSAGALVLASILSSCTDSNGPRVPKDGIPVDVESVEEVIPDSVKEAMLGRFTATLLAPPSAIPANAFTAPGAVFSSSAPGCGSGGGSDYTVTNVLFRPEPIPIYTPTRVTQDGWIKDSDMPLGFNFVFFGNTYDKVNVYSNGFLKFGTPETNGGFPNGDRIADPALPNNIIAFAWVDWEPKDIPGAIRFETRGNAPDRMFILQFNNVPEWGGRGLLMSQVVLHEGSNAITMYTNTMNITRFDHRVTQGIENADGTLAFVGDSVRLASGIMSPRVRAVYRLTNDAIRFTPLRITDTEAPSITAPANISDFPNDPGLGSAVVAVTTPGATDNCALESVTPVRSDGKAIDAPYPVGVTTITWTAKDASGNVATATQSITVIDWEDPVITAIPTSFSVNATSSLGAMVGYTFTAWDNVAVTSLTCDPPLGSRLEIGVKTVTCTASDAAGNSASGSFEVTVIDAPTQTMNLIQYVISRGLSNGTTNPLVNELQQAFDNVGGLACKKMGDFLDMVITKGVPDSWATYMTNEALRIMTVMQCSEISKKRRPQMSKP